MPLAAPALVVQLLDQDRALVDLHGKQSKVSTLLTPHIAEGDWVLVQAGFALQRMNPSDANRLSVVEEECPAAPLLDEETHE